MLRLRICPQCGTEFRADHPYFCYSCGARLPDEKKGAVSDRKPAITEDTERKDEGTERRDWKKIVLVGGVVVVLLAVTGVLAYRYLTSATSNQQPATSKLIEYPWPEKSFNLPSMKFGKTDLAQFAPHEVDFYLESSHPEILLTPFLTATASAEFREKVGLTLTEAASYLEPEYALIQQATASAFLAKMKSSTFVEKKLTEVEEVLGFRGKILDDFLVISNSEGLFNLIEASFRKVVRPLSFDSYFDQTRRTLPQKGQIFLFGKVESLWLLPEELRAGKSGYQGFVVDQKDGETVIFSKAAGQ